MISHRIQEVRERIARGQDMSPATLVQIASREGRSPMEVFPEVFGTSADELFKKDYRTTLTQYVDVKLLSDALDEAGIKYWVDEVSELVDTLEDGTPVFDTVAWTVQAVVDYARSLGGVILARKDFRTGQMSVLRPSVVNTFFRTTEELDQFLAEARCDDCGRTMDRRWAYLGMDLDGVLKVFGSSCGQSFTNGVKLSSLFGLGHKFYTRFSDVLYSFQRLNTAGNLDAHRHWIELALPGFTVEQVVKAFAVLDSEVEAGNTFYFNTYRALVSGSSGRFETAYALTRWGAAVVKTVLKFYTHGPIYRAPEPTNPGLITGEVVEICARLTKIQWKDGNFGSYRSLLFSDDSGWRYWISSSNKKFDDGVGKVFKFNAMVNGSGDGINFLKRATKISVEG